MNRIETADQLYQGGCNCCQAVFAAYNDETVLSRENALKLGATFGGGVAGMGQTCGALCGALMALAQREGDDGSDAAQKDATRAKLQAYAMDFEAQFGSCMCSDIRDKAPARTDGKKPCTVYIQYCAEALDKLI